MLKKILFISHDASRSGAPLFLYNLIKRLKDKNRIVPVILLINGGDLQNDFKELGTTYCLASCFVNATLYEKISGKVSKEKQKEIYKKRIFKEIKKEVLTLVYANTIVSTGTAGEIKKVLKVPAICHLHEMPFSIQHYYPEYLRKEVLHLFDYFIALTTSIKTFFVDKMNLDSKRFAIIPPFYIKSPRSINESVHLNKNPESFVVCCSGYGDWQKGLDILPCVLAQVHYKNQDKEFYIYWMGTVDEINKQRITFELSQIGFIGNVFFTGKVTDPENYYRACDVFLSLSKEDTFPLACVEAASYEVPVICFSKSGGMEAFVGEEAGFVVPFLDVNAIAKKLIILRADKTLRKKLGAAAKQKSEEFRIEKIASEIYEVIKRVSLIS